MIKMKLMNGFQGFPDRVGKSLGWIKRLFSSRKLPQGSLRFVLDGDDLLAETWNGTRLHIDYSRLSPKTRDQYKRSALDQWAQEREACGNPPRNIGNDWLRSAF